jgi:O-antigen ligase
MHTRQRPGNSPVPDRPAPARRLADAAADPRVKLRVEILIGFLPFLAWLVAGITATPRLAMAAYILVGILLVAKPRLGYLALLPMLPFLHPPYPHGPMFVLAGVGLGSVLVRVALGNVRLSPSVRPALWCALAFMALAAFQLLLGLGVFGQNLPVRASSEYDQVFITLSVLAIGLVVLPGRSLASYRFAFAVSLTLVAAVAILYFIEPALLQLIGLSWLIPSNAFEDRASGVLGNPNSLGLAMAAGLAWIIAHAGWHVLHGRIDRALRLAPVIPAAGLALILSFSRAAFLALGVGLIVALARRSLLAAGALAAAAVIAAVLIYPLFLQARLGQTYGAPSPAAQAALAESDRLRSLMAEAAVRAFLDAPIAGHGFATFSEISPDYSGQSILTSAHDLYLKVAAEQGVIGLALLIALLLSIVVPIWRAGDGPWMASLAVVGAFAAFSLTADTLGNAQTVAWLFFLMAAGVAQAAFMRDGASGERPPVGWGATQFPVQEEDRAAR